MKKILFVIALLINNLAQAQTSLILKFSIRLEEFQKTDSYEEGQTYEISGNKLITTYEKSYYRDKEPAQMQIDTMVLDSQKVQSIIDFLKKEGENISPYAHCRARTDLYVTLDAKIGEDYFLRKIYAPCRSIVLPEGLLAFKALLDGM